MKFKKLLNLSLPLSRVAGGGILSSILIESKKYKTLVQNNINLNSNIQQRSISIGDGTYNIYNDCDGGECKLVRWNGDGEEAIIPDFITYRW